MAGSGISSFYRASTNLLPLLRPLLQHRLYSSHVQSGSEISASHSNGTNGNSEPQVARRIYVKKIDVGFFKPVGTDYYPMGQEQHPRNVVLMHKAFNMTRDPATMYAMPEEAAFSMLSQSREQEFLEKCESRLAEYEKGKDIVVINGWRNGGFSLNSALARHLAAPVLLAMDYIPGETPSACYDRAMAEIQTYVQSNCDVLGLAVSGVPEPEYDAVHSTLKRGLKQAGVGYLGTVPRTQEQEMVSLDQVYTALRGRLLFTDLDRVRLGVPVSDVYVVTSHCGTMLGRMMAATTPSPLLVTTPDRIDTITTALAAHTAGVAPLAGIAITDHSGVPSPFRSALRAIFEGLDRTHRARAGDSKQYSLPIFITALDTYHANKAISQIEPAVLPSSHTKIEAAFSAFDEYMDSDVLMAGFEQVTVKLTPARFVHAVRQRCAANPQRIVLPESNDHRVLAAAAAAAAKGLAEVILLGPKEIVYQEAAKINVSLDGVTVLDPATSPRLDAYADTLVEARRKKNLTREGALDLLKDVNYFGTMMVRCGDADGMVSGAAHTTAATIRPGMQVLKDAKMPLVSSVFFMCLPDRVLVYGDCAVNVDPDPEQLAYIAIASADTAAAFGVEPRVAMLSYSTLGSGSGPQVEKVEQAVKIAQELRPDLKLTGPIQYDAATNERIARVKVKDDEHGVAGKATVLIFPSLDTGNNTYKAVQQSTGALAMGPIMQGLSGAVNDLSRGCTIADILDTMCCTSLQAMFKKAKE